MTLLHQRSEEVVQRERAIAAQRARWEYYKPAILIGIAGVIWLLATAVTGTWESALAYLIAWGITAVIALFVYWLCTMCWLGVDAPLGLMTVRLAGITSVVMLASAAMDAIGFSFVGLAWVFKIPVLVGLYSLLLVIFFDLELRDAIGVSILLLVVPTALWILLIVLAF
ncbi:MAG: hypothetical protein KAS72_08715 [Phycisphaerales bacterium]|nr:hypothetical protein [Phycisphaerales bacterium]